MKHFSGIPRGRTYLGGSVVNGRITSEINFKEIGCNGMG
jgi:hypothetical protein